MTIIEVFADVRCPFTHVGLRRLVEYRNRTCADLTFLVRAWPLELVNAAPLDGEAIGEKITALRDQVAPDLFTGYAPSRFPASSLPALSLEAAGYRQDLECGERVSLLLRDALFEDGLDIARDDVLAQIADSAGLSPPPYEMDAVIDDWQDGQRRGVVGSPHFFVGDEGFFCPTLRIEHIDGQLHIAYDEAALNGFLRRCIAA